MVISNSQMGFYYPAGWSIGAGVSDKAILEDHNLVDITFVDIEVRLPLFYGRNY